MNHFEVSGLLQQFQYVTPEDDDDEPTGLTAMDLGVEGDGYYYVTISYVWYLGFMGFTGYRNRLIPHSLQLASVYPGRNPARRLASSSCFG